jgi:hypothetical protein
MRVLEALSRFDETPTETAIELTDYGYVSLGDMAAVALAEARTAILAEIEEEALAEADLSTHGRGSADVLHDFASRHGMGWPQPTPSVHVWPGCGGHTASNGRTTRNSLPSGFTTARPPG